MVVCYVIRAIHCDLTKESNWIISKQWHSSRYICTLCSILWRRNRGIRKRSNQFLITCQSNYEISKSFAHFSFMKFEIKQQSQPVFEHYGSYGRQKKMPTFIRKYVQQHSFQMHFVTIGQLTPSSIFFFQVAFLLTFSRLSCQMMDS